MHGVKIRFICVGPTMSALGPLTPDSGLTGPPEERTRCANKRRHAVDYRSLRRMWGAIRFLYAAILGMPAYRSSHRASGGAMEASSAATIAARIDRLPPSQHVRKLITLISFGGWFELYDLFFTAYIAVGLFKAGIFKPTTQGLFDFEGFASFIAALFTGLFIGTIFLAVARKCDLYGPILLQNDFGCPVKQF
jgi:hypothetical protein